MKSFGSSYRALVLGASGAIGAGFVSALRADSACIEVAQVSRAIYPNFALEDEASIAAIAAELKPHGPFALIVDATGALTIDGVGPEKSLVALDAQRLMRSFQVNAIGPALLLKHFLPLMAPGRAIYAKLSARVGSISDNKKGGWYGYRASKAALNMLLQTAAIEFARKNPLGVVVAMQPGTVQSALSKPFVGGQDALTPLESVNGLLQALDELDLQGVAQGVGVAAATDASANIEHKGAYFIDYKGQTIPW